MIRPERVAIRISSGIDVDLSGPAGIRVERTKEDGLLGGFVEPDSVGTRLATTIAGNPLLTKFMFLRSEPAKSLGTGNASLAFPLFLDAGCDYAGKAGREDYEEQDRRLDEMIGRAMGSFGSSHTALLREVLEALPRDMGLLRAAAGAAGGDGAGRGGALRAIADVISKGGAPARHLDAITKASYELRSWERLHKAISRVRLAQKNAAALSDELGRKDGTNQLSTALSKIADLAEISAEAVCLDCWYERGWMPFMSSVANAGRVSLRASCPRCGGAGMLHTVILGFPDSVRPLTASGNSWFHEVVVGYAVSQIERVERVFVHKKIVPLGAAGRGEGVEADVSAVTRDGRLYVVEVTRQDDMDNVGRNIERKMKHFEGHGIPLSGAVYVTASGHGRHVGAGGARILQMRHLPDLARWIGDAMGPDPGGAA